MQKITRTAIYRPRNCEACRRSFFSRSSKKRFCDECAANREREQDRIRALKKLRNSGAREIGSKVTCKHCAAIFVLQKGPEIFCPHCSADRRNRWHREKRRNDPQRNLSERMSRRINACLSAGKQSESWTALVGYSVADLMHHLEAQFDKGMTWDNRGEWHIDHIRPLCSFEFQTPHCPQFREAWALTNLRPLWAIDNYRKSGRRDLLI